MKKITSATDKLISLGTDGWGPTHFRTGILDSAGQLGRELADFLRRNNGLYAFESALHMFPACQIPGVMDLEQWNDPTLWIDHYGDMAKGMIFFAEDIIGDQFAIRGHEIVRFKAETGLWESLAGSLEEWAKLILEDYPYQTGWHLAHAWQVEHGALRCGERLVATIPFVFGGDFKNSNLHALDAVEAMCLHGDLALQIRDVPDGTKIRFTVVD
jgi:hypothetical protein